MLNSLEILKEARELGSTTTLAEVDAVLAGYDYPALREAERVNYRIELYDKASPINGVPAEIILKDAPAGGEVYLIYVNNRLVYLQTHDPEEMGFVAMSETRALEAAGTIVDNLIEQAVDVRVREEVLRALLV